MVARFDIGVCPDRLRSDALRMLHDQLPDDQKSSLVKTLDSLRQTEVFVFEGLFVAQNDGGQLEGVCWAQPTPGRTATVWPPASTSVAAVSLLKAAGRFLDQHRVALAQTLVNPTSEVDVSPLKTAGFHKLADLAYLVAEETFFPTKEPASQVCFERFTKSKAKRFGDLLVKTYVDSLDCPGLNGVRESADILAGYAAQGESSEQHWFFVRDGVCDLGTLVLTTHGEGEVCELVYMGILPDARGRAVGWQMLQQALWQAHCMGAKRLVLAVDEQNSPALDAYRRGGLVVWDRRAVFARIGLSSEAKS